MPSQWEGKGEDLEGQGVAEEVAVKGLESPQLEGCWCWGQEPRPQRKVTWP